MTRVKSRLSSGFIKEAKDRLLADREQLMKDIKQLTSEDPILNPERTSGKVPEFEEESSQMQGHERIAAEKKVLERRLEETEAALKKVEEGSYGICENCENSIDIARLKANPQALYCLDCESRLPVEQEGA